MRRCFQLASMMFLSAIFICTLVGCGGTASSASKQQSLTPTPIPSQTVYMLTEVGVGAFRADNGQPLWTFPLSDSLDGYALTAAPGTVYVAHGTSIYALSTITGKSLWTGTGSDGPEQMTALGQYVYVSSRCTIYGYHAKDGSLAWHTDIPTVNLNASDTYYAGTKVFTENNLVFGWCGDTIIALNPESGTIVWKINLPYQLTDYSDSRIQDVEITPEALVISTAREVFDGQVYGETIGIRPSDGSQLWKIDPQDGLHIVNTTVYAWKSNGNQQGITLTALELLNGTKQWSVTDPAVDPRNPVTFSDTAFYAATGPSGGDLDVRSLQDGHVLWNSPGAGTYKSLVGDGDRVFGYLDGQGMVAWDSNTKTRLWLAQGLNGEIWIIDQRLYVSPGLNNSPLSVLDPMKGTPFWQVAPNTPHLAGGAFQVVIG